MLTKDQIDYLTNATEEWIAEFPRQAEQMKVTVDGMLVEAENMIENPMYEQNGEMATTLRGARAIISSICFIHSMGGSVQAAKKIHNDTIKEFYTKEPKIDYEYINENPKIGYK